MTTAEKQDAINPHSTTGQCPKDISIMTRISRATKIQSDEQGFVVAELIAIELTESQYGDQFEWVFSVGNSKGAKSLMREWTGLSINDEKTYYPEDGDGKGEYNKLTQMLLQLKLIDLKLLKSKEEPDIDLEKLVGKSFRFQITNDKKRPGLKRINLKTLELID
jgi:hypothetical protein